MIEGPFADTKRKPFTSADVRFTSRTELGEAKPTTFLCATVLAIPEDRTLRICSLGSGSLPLTQQNATFQLVDGAWNGSSDLAFEQTAHMLTITLPGSLTSNHAGSVRIALQDSGD